MRAFVCISGLNVNMVSRYLVLEKYTVNAQDVTGVQDDLSRHLSTVELGSRRLARPDLASLREVCNAPTEQLHG
jgi:hypothetical protein